jgi:hypothetical protein
MSKVDAQRAMRDARYAAYEARRKADGDPIQPAAGTSKASTTSTTKPTSTTRPARAAQPAETTEALCGHRSIGQKSCTRPAGHEEENHRYS